MSIQATGLTYSVPDGDERRVLFGGLDLAVEPGELVTVAGESGSGKSTLLAILGLLRHQEAGEVTIGGRATSRLGDRERARLRREQVAFVFQASNLFPSLKATEQVEVVAHVRGKLDKAARRQARELLELVGLEGRLDALPGHLSGGERQRVGIARALMSQPAVLLADEPTASLDADRATQVMEILRRETTNRGIATLVVTHDLKRGELADRRLLLRDRTLVAAEAAATV